SPQDVGAPRPWLLPSALMLLYAATFHWLPPLLRAVLAVTTIGVTMSQCWLRRPLRPAIAGLFVLSLPVIPVLQFYLGYPLRVVVGAVTAPLLQLAGLTVVREGTSLNWNGQLISIDAPCSGVRMLWAGLFLLCAVAWFYRLPAGKTMLAALISLVVIVAGNILRASALFYLEAGILQMPMPPNLAHDGVGIVTFVFTAMGIIASVHWLQRFQFPKSVQLCETSPPSFSPVSWRL
ncbi:MAG TPA: archaeosortase/exosortase family protein, partial [Blastocatellia bacterium]|nr:archaeosortase/exosortase family protein [Blastocatellia bacterium]